MNLLKSHKCFGGLTEFWKHQSTRTQTKMKFAVHRPLSEKEIRGGLIWLSGLTCNEENFITKAGSQKFLENSGLVLFCPDTSPRGLDLPGEHETYDFGSGAGFYVDATTEAYKNHYRMESYINEEFYHLVNEKFSLDGNISLMGHSMGGHGALTIGLKNPSRYQSLSAFSPLVNPTQTKWGQKAFRGYLGENETTWNTYDACKLLEMGKTHPRKILIEQGLADEFLEAQLLTKNFEDACKNAEQEFEVNYHEAYDHSYYFISSFIQKHIEYHSSALLT